ncbi:hypothetical protein DEIGR_200197 [Deinococcus grandis]|uniref:Uncharacterized protein n=1 Tax=Deinococcus grandis TaxID=57498 RepID=A0A117DPF0_9DEIO|nr:hypothetical protein DEGR_34230 [Deinococcus grandis]GAQ23342.1 hypothetical protein DEIGR_200197 [Deinococcus grandis]
MADKAVQSEQSEWEKSGFRTWSWQSGEVPDCQRNKRNPYETFSGTNSVEWSGVQWDRREAGRSPMDRHG